MRINLKKAPQSIAIVLDFFGSQPNHFDAEAAAVEPMQAGGFIGSTVQGGSCNVDVIRMNPHCNGTHTESISHLTNELVAPHEAIQQPLMLAELITLQPKPFSDQDAENSYQPPSETGDLILGVEQFTAVTKSLRPQTKSLIIRTLPNDISKKNRRYNNNDQPAYFSNEAIRWLAKHTQIEHLLVDLPSIDRLHDNGLLSNHRLFWNIEPGSHRLTKSCWPHKTITEMIYVPNEIKDGSYLLNLQVPRLNLNAVPSNPVLYSL